MLSNRCQQERKPEHKKPKLSKNNNIHGARLYSVILVIQFLEGTTISMPYGMFRIFKNRIKQIDVTVYF